jgi:hypothetical protein
VALAPIAAGARAMQSSIRGCMALRSGASVDHAAGAGNTNAPPIMIGDGEFGLSSNGTAGDCSRCR